MACCETAVPPLLAYWRNRSFDTVSQKSTQPSVISLCFQGLHESPTSTQPSQVIKSVSILEPGLLAYLADAYRNTSSPMSYHKSTGNSSREASLQLQWNVKPSSASPINTRHPNSVILVSADVSTPTGTLHNGFIAQVLSAMPEASFTHYMD